MKRAKNRIIRKSMPTESELFDAVEEMQMRFSSCFMFSMIDLDEQFDPSLVPASMSLPPGTPDWISKELVSETIMTWQPFSRQPLTPDAALTVLLSFCELLHIAEEGD